MRFTVPQFIEYETKIVGPLTFKQFAYLAIAGAVGFFFYFTLPFSLFLVSSIFLAGISLAFAFLKIGGRNITTILASFFKFTISPKMYLWRRKDMAAIAAFKKEELKGIKREIPLKISEKSQLKQLQTLIETKTK